jgi:hypothetical protein
MPRFLAVYTMMLEDLASFRSLPKTEQNTVDTIGIGQWAAWEERNTAFILDRGGMVSTATIGPRFAPSGLDEGTGMDSACRARQRTPGRNQRRRPSQSVLCLPE